VTTYCTNFAHKKHAIVRRQQAHGEEYSFLGPTALVRPTELCVHGSLISPRDQYSTQTLLSLYSQLLSPEILHQHMWMNSSAQCQTINSASFSSLCQGKGSSIVFLRNANHTSYRACVPEEVGLFPWTGFYSQWAITEELHLEL
jgi:hypothetical protein